MKLYGNVPPVPLTAINPSEPSKQFGFENESVFNTSGLGWEILIGNVEEVQPAVSVANTE